MLENLASSSLSGAKNASMLAHWLQTIEGIFLNVGVSPHFKNATPRFAANYHISLV